MGNNVYGAIALKTESGALDQIDGTTLLAGDIALVVTDANSYFYKLFSNDTSQENIPYIIKPNLNGSNKRWKLTSISETSGDLNIVGKLITDMISFSGDTLKVVAGLTTLATFNKDTSSVSFKKISSVEDTSMVNGLNAQFIGGKDGTKMMLLDGSVAFEAPVSGANPTLNSHLTTKSYVDDLIDAIDNSVATDFLVNNQLTVSNITTQVGNNLVIKTNGSSGNILATFDGSSVSFKKISSVEDTSMVNGLNAEFIRGTTLDGLVKSDGSISFTAPIGGYPPTTNTHLATRGYVDSADTTKASKGANSDITSLSGLTTALSISQGGTGSTTIEGIRNNLNLGSAALLTAGTSENNLVQLTTGGALPAVSGANLTNLQEMENDLAVRNAFRLAILGTDAATAIPGGWLDVFVADTLATKTNATYNATGDYYINQASASGTKTALTGGMFSIVGGATTTNLANLVNGVLAESAGFAMYAGTAAGSGILIDKGAGSTFDVASLRLWTVSGAGAAATFNVQISPDGTNWTTIGSFTTISNSWAGITVTETATKGRYLRVVTSGVQSGNTTYFSELEVYEFLGATSMTLIPTAFTSPATTRLELHFLHKAIDATTLGTDLKARATANNGTNWSGFGTVERLGVTVLGWTQLKVLFTGLTSGTAPKVEITTYNAKSQQVRALVMII